MVSQSALAQATDPLSVMKASLDAINAGNVDVSVATFADDAVFTTPTGSFKGKEQIRRAIMADVANHVRIEATNFQVAGDKVTYSFKQSNDRLRGLSIDFINGTTEAIIQNGKMMSLTGTLTPESRAGDNPEVYGCRAASYAEHGGDGLAYRYAAAGAWEPGGSRGRRHKGTTAAIITVGSASVSAHLVAANGDSLFAEGTGQSAPTVTPNVSQIVERYTITGGTGRFAGASGSFTVERLLNLATGVTSGTIDGDITIPYTMSKRATEFG